MCVHVHIYLHLFTYSMDEKDGHLARAIRPSIICTMMGTTQIDN